MKKHVWILLTVLLISSCNSEDHEWSKFENIKFETSGIVLSSSVDGFTVQGNLPSTKSTFSIIPDQKHRQIAYVTSVTIDGVRQEKADDFSGEPPYLESLPILSGDWGTIDHRSESNRYEIVVEVNENHKGVPRSIEFQIGYGYQYLVVKITQEASTEQAEIR